MSAESCNFIYACGSSSCGRFASAPTDAAARTEDIAHWRGLSARCSSSDSVHVRIVMEMLAEDDAVLVWCGKIRVERFEGV